MLSDLDAVVFDFDGVLNRNYDTAGFFWSRDLEKDFGFSVQAFTAALFNEYFTEILVGRRDLHHALERILPELGCQAPADVFTSYWFERDLTPCRDMLTLVGELRASGLRCVIGTNNEQRRTDFLWEQLLKDHVDKVYAAGPMGVAKPARAFFEAIQTDLGCQDPIRLLLVDDIPANVIGAREAGWKAIQYGDYTRKELGNPSELRRLLGL